MNEYTKLGALVNSQFTITKAEGYVWKMYDPQQGKYLTSESWQEGYDKRYKLQTDKGILELSKAQMSQLLEGVVREGVSDINGKTYSVKSNGKTGNEVRYWLNPTKREEVKSIQDPEVRAKLEANRPAIGGVDQEMEDEIDLSSIPF